MPYLKKISIKVVSSNNNEILYAKKSYSICHGKT